MSFVKNLLKKKILGVSVGGMLGTASGTGLLGSSLGSKAAGVNPLDDLKAGARNAAVIVPGVSAASAIGGGGVPGAPAAPSGPSADDPLGILTEWKNQQAGNADPSRFRSVMDFLGKHKSDILDYGSAAEQIAQRHRQNKMQDELLARARADDPRRQQLRAAGTAALLDNSRPDLSSVYADPNNPNGPTARYRRVQVGSRL